MEINHSMLYILTNPGCGLYQIPRNGNVDREIRRQDGSAFLVFFKCNAGYDLVGLGIMTCKEDGQWDRSPPTCTGTAGVSRIFKYSGGTFERVSTIKNKFDIDVEGFAKFRS